MFDSSLPARTVSWIAFLFRRPLISDLYELATIMCEEVENAGWFAINFSLELDIFLNVGWHHLYAKKDEHYLNKLFRYMMMFLGNASLI